MSKHLVADVKWAAVRSYLAASKHLVLPFKELPSATAERFPRVAGRRRFMVPMRDAVQLSTDVYLPADRTGAMVMKPRPVMLIRMPYGIRESYAYMPAVGRYWARRGFAAVIQDVRGKFGSQGQWEPLMHEVEDGYDAIDWSSQQPFCDGRVVMTGESYYGFTQWAAASSGHPALVAISPGDMGLDLYGLLFEGGVLCLATTGMWVCDQSGRRYLNWYRFNTRHEPIQDMARAAGVDAPLYTKLFEHLTRDPFWDDYDFRGMLDRIDVPVMVWSGWYDSMLPGVLATWAELERRRPDLYAQRRLVIGATDHETSTDFDQKVGRIRVPAGPRSWDRVLEFMDDVLDGSLGAKTDSRVRAYVTGAQAWHESTLWPPSGVDALVLHFCGDALTRAPGPTQRTFVHDPAHPVNTWEKRDVWAATKGLRDRRKVHRRPDVLVYLSDPLPCDADVLGAGEVTVAVSTAAVDADVCVSLVEVYPDGYAQLVTEAIVRLSRRGAPDEICDVTAGTVYQISIPLPGVGHRFPAGHRIAVEVAGSSFDRWDRNPHAGATTVHGGTLNLPLVVV